MRSEFSSSAYTSQAGLLVAGTLVVSAPERASEELQYVMAHTNDPELAMVARLRLARVLEYREQYDEALTTLAVAKPGKFAGRKGICKYHHPPGWSKARRRRDQRRLLPFGAPSTNSTIRLGLSSPPDTALRICCRVRGLARADPPV